MITPLILFVHGWGTDSKVWRGTAKEIAGNSIYRTIDLPGHGGVNRWSIDTLAPALREIESVVGDEEPGGVVGIGWSIGGMALLQKAAKNPHMFKALVLIGSGASFIKRDGYEYGQPKGRVKVMLDGLRIDPFETIKKFYPLNFTPVEMEQNSVKEFLNYYSPPGPIICTEPGDARPPGCYPAFDYAQITEALGALYNTDLRDTVSTITTPTLIVHGTKDSVCPVEAGRALHDKLKNSEIEEFEECGHAPFITAQERFTATVKTFLKRVTEDG